MITGTPVDVRRENKKIIVLFSVGDISSEIHFFGETEEEAAAIEEMWGNMAQTAGEFNDWYYDNQEVDA